MARQHFSPVSRDLFSKGLILGVSGSFLLIYEVHGKVEIVSLFVKEQVIDGLPLQTALTLPSRGKTSLKKQNHLTNFIFHGERLV